LKTSNISKLLKASYIDELQTALEEYDAVFKRKSSFYYRSLVCALLSTIPYVVCLGFHISKKEDKIQKVEIINSEINRKLPQIDTMGKQNSSTNTKDTKNAVSTKKLGITTKLPGVDSSKVIPSQPILIREDCYRPSNKR
jgi:hypothetical protein